MNRVVIVEDETRFRKDLVDFLSLCGFHAEGVGSIADYRLRDADAEVVIVDVGLPDGSGFDLVRDIRSSAEAGIILLTSRSESEDRIHGYESGADLYLVKDVTLREIEAAIRSLLRRTSARGTGQVAETIWQLDCRNWKLIAPNQLSLTLTATEFKLVKLLLERPDETCSRDELAAIITRPQVNFDDRYLDAVISRVRRKIESQTQTAAPIRVVYGVGYTFTGAATVQ